MEKNTEFASKIKSIRERQNMSIEELSENSGVKLEVLKAMEDMQNETKDNNGTQEQWLLVSGFSRFNYGYKDKYLFVPSLAYFIILSL